MPPTKRNPDLLKNTIIDAAEAIIIEDGLDKCTARAITQRAGCALGALSYLFGGLEFVIIEVNLRTLHLMNDAVFHAAENHPSSPLDAMAVAYFDYAQAHLNRWKTLFSLRLGTQKKLPDAFITLRQALIARIATFIPHSATSSQNASLMMARALYESVHGVVVLSIDHDLGGTTEDTYQRLRLITHKMAQAS